MGNLSFPYLWSWIESLLPHGASQSQRVLGSEAFEMNWTENRWEMVKILNGIHEKVMFLTCGVLFTTETDGSDVFGSGSGVKRGLGSS